MFSKFSLSIIGSLKPEIGFVSTSSGLIAMVNHKFIFSGFIGGNVFCHQQYAAKYIPNVKSCYRYVFVETVD